MAVERVPKYRLIMNEIKAQIRNGELKAHDYLGTQLDLARKFKTSEITSRRALDELSNEGVVYRIKGKGTFIQEVVNDYDGQLATMPESPGRSETSAVWTAREPLIKRIFVVSSLTTCQDDLRTMTTNRFFLEVWRAMSAYCKQHGLEIALISHEEVLAASRSDAAYVFIPASVDQAIMAQVIERLQAPVVTIHGYFPHLGESYVISDNITGGYMATHHLISQGHREIAIVLTGASLMGLNQEFALRFEGYKLAMQQHNVPFVEENVLLTQGDDESAGYETAMRLLDRERPPTAVFYTTDRKAAGGLFAMQARGLSVPEAMSVIGYDDQYFSEFLNPPLTTINQNAEHIGRRAVEILIANARSGKKMKDEIVPTLKIRASVRDIGPK